MESIDWAPKSRNVTYIGLFGALGYIIYTPNKKMILITGATRWPLSLLRLKTRGLYVSGV